MVSHLVPVVGLAIQLVDEDESQVGSGVDEGGALADSEAERAVGRAQFVARDAVAARVRVDGRRHDERAADLRRLGQLVHDPLLREPRSVVVHVHDLHQHLIATPPPPPPPAAQFTLEKSIIGYSYYTTAASTTSATFVCSLKE